MAIDDFDKFKKSLPSKGFSNQKNIADDDCDRPACDDTATALIAALNQAHKTGRNTASSNHGGKSLECPPTKGVIGTSGWVLLHSMAAWYPDTPSKKDQTMMKQFFSSFARFFPCTYCSEDFQKNIKEKPVQTESREGLCLWLCDQHNIVNEKLGKPLFKCDMQTLDERWRKSSDPKCNPNSK